MKDSPFFLTWYDMRWCYLWNRLTAVSFPLLNITSYARYASFFARTSDLTLDQLHLIAFLLFFLFKREKKKTQVQLHHLRSKCIFRCISLSCYFPSVHSYLLIIFLPQFLPDIICFVSSILCSGRLLWELERPLFHSSSSSFFSCLQITLWSQGM